MTFYKHYNGGEYIGVGKAIPTNTIEKFEPIDYWFLVATHTETKKFIRIFYDDNRTQYFAEGEEELMVYSDKSGKTWARPYEMFFGNVEIDGKEQPRFQETDFSNITLEGVDQSE